MNSRRILVVAAAGLSAALWTYACGDGATEPPTPPPDPSRPTTVVENPDRAALVALYQTTDGPNWVNSDKWLTGAPLGEWYGVDTDRSGRVVRLDLRVNQLTGQIPSELGNLAGLESLNLGWNDLRGSIPLEFGNLGNLRFLNAYGNNLTGRIPPELGNLTELTQLNLGQNILSGPIPPELGALAKLTRLYLSLNYLTGPIPPELGKLVNLTDLYLASTNLSGPIPPELGKLVNLKSLELWWTELKGPIPTTFLELKRLTSLTYHWRASRTAGLCAPGTTEFVTWLNGLEKHRGPYCNESDVEALQALYESADGTNWTGSAGWLQDPATAGWFGISADSLGRVVELDLSGNGLSGRIPGSLGNMARLNSLRIGENALSGPLPQSLARLTLEELHYSNTEMCLPTDPSFREWLNGVRSHDGTGLECSPLSDRDILVALYEATGGRNWRYAAGWLTDAPLNDWYGVYADHDGRVNRLRLSRNNLTGWLPTELGSLASLSLLNLRGNVLTGPIPQELGGLANLRYLDLGANQLEGPIPADLGNLASLYYLRLVGNTLDGGIPQELGGLASLQTLDLGRNSLTGPIPTELGSLANLEELLLDDNDLVGAIPSEFRELTGLRMLKLDNNTRLAGALPRDLTRLRTLDALLLSATGLCVPRESGFLEWLEGVAAKQVVLCDGKALSTAYLTQAVQSLHFPIPLVAGEAALLRVFVTAQRANSEDIPPVRANFFLPGMEKYVVDIPGKPTSIPAGVDEGRLASSANADVPGEIVQPGLEMVIEIDPDGTLDPALGVAGRIPETGRMAIDVQTMPLFDMTLVPFIWTAEPDSSVVELIEAMAADPENHEMLWKTRTWLPIGDLDVTSHEPVITSTNSTLDLLGETAAIRVMEGGTGHYAGIIGRPTTYSHGIAELGGRASVSVPDDYVLAHELGHNLSLGHGPCDSVHGDRSFPYPDGSIGAWGYDFRDGGRLVEPTANDVVAGCNGLVLSSWISDYAFDKALRFRLSDADGTRPPARSLLLWGGVGTDSVPFLEPAFVVDAPPELPRSGGEYRIAGRTGGGVELFSLSFDMPQIADGDGSSSFAFALPVRPGWENSLASLTLTGPGGSTTLGGDSDLPMVILRNPRTGQIRGILRDLPPATQAAADAEVPAAPGLEILFSRGIPGADAWRR